MSGSRQYKGVTEPLSDKVATPTETKATTALIDELKRQNNFESPAETQKRYTPIMHSLQISILSCTTVVGLHKWLTNDS